MKVRVNSSHWERRVVFVVVKACSKSSLCGVHGGSENRDEPSHDVTVVLTLYHVDMDEIYYLESKEQIAIALQSIKTHRLSSQQ